MSIFYKICISIAFTLVLFSFSKITFSQELVPYLIEKNGLLQTNKGILKISRNEGLWQISIGEKILHSNWSIELKAFPNRQYPKIITIESFGGGNCCAPEWYVIDLEAKNTRMVKIPGYTWKEPKWKYLPQSGILEATYAPFKDEIGDSIERTYRYNNKYGEWIDKGIKSVYLSALEPERADLLANIDARKYLLNVVGRTNYQEFRDALGVRFKAQIFEGRYLIESGCTPHACNNTLGIAIFDATDGRAWGLNITDIDFKSYGSTSAFDIQIGALAAFDSILKNHQYFNYLKADLDKNGNIKLIKR